MQMYIETVVNYIGAAMGVELGALLGSKHIFIKLFKRIVRAPQACFDVLPKGRILDRLSNDIFIMNVLLPQNLRGAISKLFRVCWLKKKKKTRNANMFMCMKNNNKYYNTTIVAFQKTKKFNKSSLVNS
uniref:Multidrug resistance-associated protein 1 n=1 Tax=Ceratitis capitata TaxID=7213 RepID=W8B859_CERCA